MYKRQIIELAEDLGYEVVAEGVERDEDLAVLAELSCTLVQGFAFSRPVTADALLPVMAELGRRPEPAPVG